MYSYETLLSVSGGAKWGDRLERLAFNALPATLSEDMWTHQYLQMTNQPDVQYPSQRTMWFSAPISGESHLFGPGTPFRLLYLQFQPGMAQAGAFCLSKNGKRACLRGFGSLPGRNGDWRRSGLLQAGNRISFPWKTEIYRRDGAACGIHPGRQDSRFCSFRSS